MACLQMKKAKRKFTVSHHRNVKGMVPREGIIFIKRMGGVVVVCCCFMDFEEGFICWFGFLGGLFIFQSVFFY